MMGASAWRTKMKIAIESLRIAYSKIATIDPAGGGYKNLCKFLDAQDAATLCTLANAKIKFVSKLAANRCTETKK